MASLFHSFYLNSSLACAREALFACTTTLKFASLFHSIGYDNKEIHTYLTNHRRKRKRNDYYYCRREESDPFENLSSIILLSFPKYSVFLEWKKREKREKLWLSIVGKGIKDRKKNKVKKILGIATHDCLLVKKKKKKGGEVDWSRLY